MPREDTQFSSSNQPSKRRGQGYQSLITTRIKDRLESHNRLSVISAFLKDPNLFPNQNTVTVWAPITTLDELIDVAILEAKSGNIRALEWIVDRAYGKVPDKLALTDTEGNDLVSYFKIDTTLLTTEEHALLLEFEHRTQKAANNVKDS
jgi:hypothetical protein